MAKPLRVCSIIFSIILVLQAAGTNAAVTSTGEINVMGDDQGVVPASSNVTLVVTVIIDRSQAEPGEEIRTIEIQLPNGFVVEPSNVQSVLRDGRQMSTRVEILGNSVRIVFIDLIADFSNSVYEIVFVSRTPSWVSQQVTFRTRLRNQDDSPIGEFIKPGQADGKVNNDRFSLQVIPNVPPPAVLVLEVTTDLDGENDVTVRWQKSEDVDVSGYFIYRDNDSPINVEDRSSTVYRDVNVVPGTHKYAVEAYKTPLLRSERSGARRIVVSADTASPRPPQRLEVVGSGSEIRVTWASSLSSDVTRYQVFFGSSLNRLNPLIDGEILAESNKVEYEFSDSRQLGIGIFIYAVEAIDEAGNKSPIEQKDLLELRILGAPAPNPFTPLSDNPKFNRVFFPARAIEDAEGEFLVSIFDVNGAMVRELRADAGIRELEWDGRDEVGEVVASGVYVYQIQLGGSFKTGTVIVAK